MASPVNIFIKEAPYSYLKCEQAVIEKTKFIIKIYGTVIKTTVIMNSVTQFVLLGKQKHFKMAIKLHFFHFHLGTSLVTPKFYFTKHFGYIIMSTVVHEEI